MYTADGCALLNLVDAALSHQPMPFQHYNRILIYSLRKPRIKMPDPYIFLCHLWEGGALQMEAGTILC